MSLRNGVILSLALSTLTFLVACGGSSSPTPTPPPSGGFTSTDFSGTYVISISGLDFSNPGVNNQNSFAITGTLTASSGSLTGTVDVNDPPLALAINSSAGPSDFVQTGLAVTGNYSVNSDGRGNGSIAFTFDGQNERFGLDFVLTQNGHGLIIRFDGPSTNGNAGGTGSGTIDAQGSASQSSLTALTFSLSGADSLGNALGTIGGFSLDASGNVVSGTGTMDVNDSGSASPDLSITTPGSSFVVAGGSGTATVINPLGTFGFDVWVIDSTHMKLIETDLSGGVLSGDAYTQGSTLPQGTVAYTLAGFDVTGDPFVAGGLLGTSGSSLSGFEDFANADSASGTNSSVSGACTLTAGRCQITFSGLTNGNAALQTFEFAAYPFTTSSGSSGLQLLEVDSLGLSAGAAYLETAASFGTPQGYGLNLSGVDLTSGSEVDDIAEFTAQNVGSNGSGQLTGILDINDGGPQTGTSGTAIVGGQYAPVAPADGLGQITATSPQLLLEYYVVDSSTAIFIEADSVLSVGTFQLQNASSVSAGIAQPAAAMLRQASRAYVTKRRESKKK